MVSNANMNRSIWLLNLLSFILLIEQIFSSPIIVSFQSLPSSTLNNESFRFGVGFNLKKWKRSMIQYVDNGPSYIHYMFYIVLVIAIFFIHLFFTILFGLMVQLYGYGYRFIMSIVRRQDQ